MSLCELQIVFDYFHLVYVLLLNELEKVRLVFKVNFTGNVISPVFVVSNKFYLRVKAVKRIINQLLFYKSKKTRTQIN